MIQILKDLIVNLFVCNFACLCFVDLNSQPGAERSGTMHNVPADSDCEDFSRLVTLLLAHVAAIF